MVSLVALALGRMRMPKLFASPGPGVPPDCRTEAGAHWLTMPVMSTEYHVPSALPGST